MPKSSFIARMLKAKIQPPSTNAVIFLPSKYSSPSENRLEYIESDEEDASDMEVVESTQRPEDEMNSGEDTFSLSASVNPSENRSKYIASDDEPDTASLFGLSYHSELELARMVNSLTNA